MNFKKLLQYVALNGGATLDERGNVAALESGYMVSLAGHEKKITLATFTRDDLRAYKALAKRRGGYVGLWLDGDALYLDISVCVEDYQTAALMGRANDQLAIYDIKGGKSIYLQK